MQPETRYAMSGSAHIAYQVVGDGPFDVVFVPGFISNLDSVWEDEKRARFFHQIASYSRLILFDKRGTGLSDRVGGIPGLEQRMDDVRAVMDAAHSDRAAIFGISEGGAMAMLFAATYPERTRGLVLCGTYPHYPSWVLAGQPLEDFIASIHTSWGTGASLAYFAPTKAADEKSREAWARFERLGASPSAVIELTRMNAEIDVRHVLPAIRVPTLILHRVGDTRVSVEAARFMATNIPGARYIELPGVDHVIWFGDDLDRIAAEVEEFLTGAPPPVEIDRVLATVLFTDIVDSTRKAAALGDREWRRLLEGHHAAVRREIARHRGREIKTLGDGFLVTFEGPARAVRCAQAMREGVHPLGLEIRSGLHTGEVEMLGDDVGGIAVNIAARVTEHSGPGEVLVSSTVRDLVAGSGLRFVDRGPRQLKGLDEEMRLFQVA
jgi:class 3 adenylate cyclase